jgi:hypothetical protein
LSWFIRHSWIWRLTVMLLLGSAIFGPWFYERIAIPLPYDCSGSNVRLSDSICGIPLSGISIILQLLAGLFTIIPQMVTDAQDLPVRAYELIILFIFLIGINLILLPVITSFRMLLKKQVRIDQYQHLLALGMAGVVSLGWAVVAVTSMGQYGGLWGSWFYTSVITCALTLELVFRAWDEKSLSNRKKM